MRLQQIVMNLLSNAFKFTDAGGVSMTIERAAGGWNADNASLAAANQVIAFAITDSGIGISPEHQKTIFEAFQQADGTISRRHGGTGLGLSISRELSTLLGGEIALSSRPGIGSTFTLYLPLTSSAAEIIPEMPSSRLPGRFPGGAPAQPSLLAAPATDTRSLREKRPELLLVESDPADAGILLELADQHGFEGMVINRGSELLQEIERHVPMGIVLDLQLPDMLGLVLLDQLKRNVDMKQVPIHVISVEEDRDRALRMGAYSFTAKTADRQTLVRAFERLRGRLLGERHYVVVAGGSAEQRRSLAATLASDAFDIIDAPISKAKRILTDGNAGCLVILPKSGTSIAPFLEWLRQHPQTAGLPVVAHVPDGPDEGLAATLERHLVTTVVSDDDANRLTDVVATALRLRAAEEPASEETTWRTSNLAGRTVAIIDDDIRNIFSLTALLEQHQIQVLYAESGHEGLSLLERHPEIDIVLIDIMMPELNGYETIGEIRRREPIRHLPLIAVTAKAMADDRERCLEAGASDYLSKPIDTDRLLSVLRVWLDNERTVATVD
jgi:CheY-like chemotaxis protein